MQSQSNDFSYFLTGERDLESLEKDYFSARPLDEQSDQEDNYGSDFSSDETGEIVYKTSLGYQCPKASISSLSLEIEAILFAVNRIRNENLNNARKNLKARRHPVSYTKPRFCKRRV